MAEQRCFVSRCGSCVLARAPGKVWCTHDVRLQMIPKDHIHQADREGPVCPPVPPPACSPPSITVWVCCTAGPRMPNVSYLRSPENDRRSPITDKVQTCRTRAASGMSTFYLFHYTSTAGSFHSNKCKLEYFQDEVEQVQYKI